MKKGISLIVLVVTIAVMLIIAATIILNIAGFGNTVSDANKAKIQSDVLSLKNDMEMHFAASPRENFSDLHVEGNDLTLYIPSIQGKRSSDGLLYTDGLVIDQGILKIKRNTFRKQEEDALKEVLPLY